MSRYFPLFFGIIFSCTLYAQDYEPERKFGKLPLAELTQKASRIDSSAGAEVLYDFAKVDFEYNSIVGLAIRTYIHRRIKIFQKSELDKGNFSVILYDESGNNRETISDIKGITYNVEDGKMVTEELYKKSIFFEKVRDGVFQYKISLPNVKEGSVVEYQYEITTPLRIRNKPKAWAFQSDIPVKWSEIDITIPAHFYYQVIMGGYLPLYRNTQNRVNVNMGNETFNTYGINYDFVVKDAPAFKDEKFVSADKDYISLIDFELSSIQLPGEPEKKFNTTWEELDRTLLTNQYWGNRFKPTKEIKELAANFKNIADPLERFSKVHAFIAKEFKWDGYTSLWASDNIKKLMDTKTGNASELNIVLCTALREAGLDANPVIISTRANGRINLVYPLLDKFNYTLVAVSIGDQLIFADATDPISSPGILPSRCIVDDGRLINENGSYFTKITSNDSYSESVNVTATIDVDKGKISGKFNRSCAGLLAHDLRTVYQKEGKTAFENTIKGGDDTWEYDNITLKNFDNSEESTLIAFDFAKEEGGVMPEMIYLPTMLTYALKENPLKRKTREFPVDFGHVINQTYSCTYKIPAGFEIESLPQSIALAIPGSTAKFLYSVVKSGEDVVVLSRLTFRKKTYPADEYPYLRELYAKIVEKHAEQIVLKQIN